MNVTSRPVKIALAVLVVLGLLVTVAALLALHLPDVKLEEKFAPLNARPGMEVTFEDSFYNPFERELVVKDLSFKLVSDKGEVMDELYIPRMELDIDLYDQIKHGMLRGDIEVFEPVITAKVSPEAIERTRALLANNSRDEPAGTTSPAELSPTEEIERWPELLRDAMERGSDFELHHVVVHDTTIRLEALSSSHPEQALVLTSPKTELTGWTNLTRAQEMSVHTTLALDAQRAEVKVVLHGEEKRGEEDVTFVTEGDALSHALIDERLTQELNRRANRHNQLALDFKGCTLATLYGNVTCNRVTLDVKDDSDSALQRFEVDGLAVNTALPLLIERGALRADLRADKVVSELHMDKGSMDRTSTLLFDELKMSPDKLVKRLRSFPALTIEKMRVSKSKTKIVWEDGASFTITGALAAGPLHARGKASEEPIPYRFDGELPGEGKLTLDGEFQLFDADRRGTKGKLKVEQERLSRYAEVIEEPLGMKLDKGSISLSGDYAVNQSGVKTSGEYELIDARFAATGDDVFKRSFTNVLLHVGGKFSEEEQKLAGKFDVKGPTHAVDVKMTLEQSYVNEERDLVTRRAVPGPVDSVRVVLTPMK